jgi:hypothetical protein
MSLRDGLLDESIEVKSCAAGWGSAFVETEHRPHPTAPWALSGLSTTEAAVWLFAIRAGDDVVASVAVRTDRLREVAADSPVSVARHQLAKGRVVNIGRLLGAV